MKKILLVLSLVLTFSLVGCSSTNEFKNVSTSDVEKAVLESGLLVENPMSADVMEFDYFNDVQDSIEEGFVSRAAMIVALEDVVFIKAVDEENAAKVLSTLESYKQDMVMRPFADGYGKQENATRAANTIVEQKGKYVYLISADKVEDLQKVILDKIQK